MRTSQEYAILSVYFCLKKAKFRQIILHFDVA